MNGPNFNTKHWVFTCHTATISEQLQIHSFTFTVKNGRDLSAVVGIWTHDPRKLKTQNPWIPWVGFKLISSEKQRQGPKNPTMPRGGFELTTSEKQSKGPKILPPIPYLYAPYAVQCTVYGLSDDCLHILQHEGVWGVHEVRRVSLGGGLQA